MGLIETLLALPALATPDFFNGCFEFGGALWLLKDVAALYRARKIEGVHWAPRAYFALWGVWNLFYYPALSQWWSFSGGLAIVCVNTFWVLQLLWYSFTDVLLTMPGQYGKPAWQQAAEEKERREATGDDPFPQRFHYGFTPATGNTWKAKSAWWIKIDDGTYERLPIDEDLNTPFRTSGPMPSPSRCPHGGKVGLCTKCEK